jgi:DNA-binding transcriptional MerR regulator/methylmalonyl-CoA mutase cobalamin-binding subunit
MGANEATFPLRVAVRLTGLSAERLRAWEARHAVVQPIRTPGGSRRYRATDLERLRLLREAVDAGHRIGDLAGLDEPGLRACLASPAEDAGALHSTEALWHPLARLEVDRVRELLEEKRSALGTLDFARSFAPPFLYEVGRRWAAGELSVAAEHLASSLLSSMLGAALHAHRPSRTGLTIVFATPSGERHCLGLCVAALTAADAGAAPIYLGAEVPEEDLVESAMRARASVLALGLVTLAPESAEDAIRRIRSKLSARIEIWIGGAAALRCAPIRGVERIASLDQLKSHVEGKRMARDGLGA